MIPLQIRVGGAFMALALVLIIQAVIAFINGGGVFTITLGSVFIWIGALLFGGFATMRRDQPASKKQVAALIVAVALILLSVFLPTIELGVMATYWLAMYAGVAVLCALILRRSAM
ncbi:hypothetical protein [Corynebacterium lubricantis]|uniref:hypothetical protein n=1 Tax=Corynebacterium lubricantis TaxID=541095 RepID=UPI0003786849|nr:hypothetical protein [Corynebacterium lubricantis]